MYKLKRRDAGAELLFCLFNQLLFWRSCCRRLRGILKSLVSCSCAIQGPILNLNLCKRGIWFLESEKFLLVESGILGFRIQNTAQESGIALGIQNPSSTDKRWNRVPGIWNPRCGFHNQDCFGFPYCGVINLI